MTNDEAFDALRIRIWADAHAKVTDHGPLGPLAPDEIELYGFKDQAEVDEFNKSESERDYSAEKERADRRWDAWVYLADRLGWDLPPVEVIAAQPYVWCAP